MSEYGRAITNEDDWLFEWREQLGIEVMYSMTCTHEGDDFGPRAVCVTCSMTCTHEGPRAVCVTCFDNTQRIGALVQHIAATAWDRGRAAERRDWEFTADLVTPDEDRQPLTNPYRPATPDPTRRAEGAGGDRRSRR
jgi:hypothetical protein